MYRFLTPAAAILAAVLFAGSPAAGKTVQPSKTTTPSSQGRACTAPAGPAHKTSHKHGRKVLTKKHQPKRSKRRPAPATARTSTTGHAKNAK